jgi:hypothetical protein
MAGTTADGWPYSQGSEKAYTLDDTSIALANKLQGMFVIDNIDDRPAAGEKGRRFYSSDTGGVDLDIGTGWRTIQAHRVSALPLSPFDGMEVLFQDATFMVPQRLVWRLRYDSSISAAAKWLFLGGGALANTSIVDASGYSSTGNATTTPYTAPDGGAALSIPVPVSGRYRIEHSWRSKAASTGGVTYAQVGASLPAASDIGNAAAAYVGYGSGPVNAAGLTYAFLSGGATVSQYLKHVVGEPGWYSTVNYRELTLTPVVLGGTS